MASKYQIYGMGNALVDFEIETTPDELIEQGIDKGVMTLIDVQRHHELYDYFGQRSKSRACGGSAANTILGAQTLGSRCFYSCLVANDETGQFFKSDLLSHGVDTNLTQESLPDGLTGKCLVMITEDADRTMNTFLGITGDISFQQINEEALLNSELLYIEGYLAGSPIALEGAVSAAAFARKNNVKTAISLSDPNIVKFCREGLEKIIGEGVDYLFCNHDEAIAYSQKPDLEQAVDQLLTISETLIVTLGERGSIIINKRERIEVSGVSVKAIDSNGAGDLFAGSFLHGLCRGLGLAQAGKLASFASAQLVTQFGPRLNDLNLSGVRNYDKSLG